MRQAITLELSETDVLTLAPYQTNLVDLLYIGLHRVKLDQGLALYRQGDVSLWRAARLAGVPLRELTEHAVACGLRATLDEDMIQEELA